MKKRLAITLFVAIIVTLTACASMGEHNADTSVEAGDISKTEDSKTEENSPVIGMANPWTESSLQEISEEYTIYFAVPEGAANVSYMKADSINMAEADFVIDNAECCYRVEYTREFEDISGLYYEWSSKEEISLGEDKATYYRYISSEECIDVICWFDEVFSRSFSLSARGNNLESFDLISIAEELYYKISSEDCLLEYLDEDFSTVFDVRYIKGVENEDGSVTFKYNSHLYPAAGNCYMTVSKKQNVDYMSLITELKGNNKFDVEEVYSLFGKKGVDSYSISQISEVSEAEGVWTSCGYIVIPDGQNVILIESLMSFSSDEETNYVISSAFETLFDNFSLEDF